MFFRLPIVADAACSAVVPCALGGGASEVVPDMLDGGSRDYPDSESGPPQ